MPHILALLAVLAQKEHDEAWILAEIRNRLAEIRNATELGSRVIPACLGQLERGMIDDVLTGTWLATALVTIDYDVLLELDALGAALNLEGCVERLGFHMRDLVVIPSDPWERGKEPRSKRFIERPAPCRPPFAGTLAAP